MVSALSDPLLAQSYTSPLVGRIAPHDAAAFRRTTSPMYMALPSCITRYCHPIGTAFASHVKSYISTVFEMSDNWAALGWKHILERFLKTSAGKNFTKKVKKEGPAAASDGANIVELPTNLEPDVEPVRPGRLKAKKKTWPPKDDPNVDWNKHMSWFEKFEGQCVSIMSVEGDENRRVLMTSFRCHMLRVMAPLKRKLKSIEIEGLDLDLESDDDVDSKAAEKKGFPTRILAAANAGKVKEKISEEDFKRLRSLRRAEVRNVDGSSMSPSYVDAKGRNKILKEAKRYVRAGCAGDFNLNEMIREYNGHLSTPGLRDNESIDSISTPDPAMNSKLFKLLPTHRPKRRFVRLDLSFMSRYISSIFSMKGEGKLELKDFLTPKVRHKLYIRESDGRCSKSSGTAAGGERVHAELEVTSFMTNGVELCVFLSTPVAYTEKFKTGDWEKQIAKWRKLTIDREASAGEDILPEQEHA